MLHPPPRPWRRTARVLRLAPALAALAASTLVVVGTATAAAHSPTGSLELVSVEPADGDAVVVTVELRYDSDAHPVLDGVVRLSGERSDGVVALPVTFSSTDVPGRLAATAQLPGPQRWSLLVSSTEPAAELRASYDPLDPSSAASSARGGEFGPVEEDTGVPLAAIALGCAAVLVVFVLVRWRARRRG